MINKTIKFALTGVCIFISTMVFALDLTQAKQQGLVGERSDGYLGAVIERADIKVLITDINQQRKQQYSALAKKNGITLKQVEQLAAKKTFSKTLSGHYIWQNNAWIKK